MTQPQIEQLIIVFLAVVAVCCFIAARVGCKRDRRNWSQKDVEKYQGRH